MPKPCAECLEGLHRKCSGDMVPALYCGCRACNTAELFVIPPDGHPADQPLSRDGTTGGDDA